MLIKNTAPHYTYERCRVCFFFFVVPSSTPRKTRHSDTKAFL
uniref:Uncharacterized protein n=1 Tax=Human herpesvirus 2 TaxID=10310 RepID=A0A481TCE8_HHV2|nr:hypothetical protein [Human alphaherpesvirus 2]